MLQQKEAEGKIAYENIMSEVQGLRMHVRGSCITVRGGVRAGEEGQCSAITIFRSYMCFCIILLLFSCVFPEAHVACSTVRGGIRAGEEGAM